MAGFSPAAVSLLLASALTPRSSHIFIAESFDTFKGSPDGCTTSPGFTLQDLLLGSCWSVSSSRSRFRMSTPTPQCCSSLWPFAVSPSIPKGSVAASLFTGVAAGSDAPVAADALSRSLRLDAASLFVFSTAFNQIQCVRVSYKYCLDLLCIHAHDANSITCKCSSTASSIGLKHWTQV